MNRPACESCPNWQPECSGPYCVVEPFCRNTLNNWTNPHGVRQVLRVGANDSCQHHPDMWLWTWCFRVQRIVTMVRETIARSRG